MNTDITPAPQPDQPATPVMDVQPPAEAPAPAPNDSAPMPAAQQPVDLVEHAKQPKAKAPKAPKQPRSSVGIAIAATVVIVLGLAALATYAFLKTK